MLGSEAMCGLCHSLGHENPNHSYRAAETKNLLEKMIYREKDDADTWHRHDHVEGKERKREGTGRGRETGV